MPTGAKRRTPCGLLLQRLRRPRHRPTATRERPERPRLHRTHSHLFTVENDFGFASTCGFICWPTISAPSIAYYSAGESGIPAWDNSLLITSLKHGVMYQLMLSEDGQAVEGELLMYFDSANRYRDHAFSPDGRPIYTSTDYEGLTHEPTEGSLGFTPELENPGAILAFTYQGEE